MTIHHINPTGFMDQLSQLEVNSLTKSAHSELYQLYRNCSLAVLNSGAMTDDSHALLHEFANFKIDLIRRERGIKLELHDSPNTAFVDGKLITNIQHHLFSVLRDILFIHAQRDNTQLIYDLTNSEHISNYIFSILRNAGALISGNTTPNLVVCWGGHAIEAHEYAYCQAVGTELGLRELNIVTGCGAGVMEAPMKGATLGHAKQCYKNSRFIGITEPSIIASEPPNAIVNELIIMPDIEKRLEAFIRMGHSIIIFPGGPGTAEELLYIIGVMLHRNNQQHPLPIVLTAPEKSADYLHAIDEFIGSTLGAEAQKLYTIIIDDPVKVAQTIKEGVEKVTEYRSLMRDSYHFNWSLTIDIDFQMPFLPTHENMRDLNLHRQQPTEKLAAALRRAFSGIVAGNIKPYGIDRIKQFGPYELKGDRDIMQKIDALLQRFVAQHRMKLSKETYQPCYKIIH